MLRDLRRGDAHAFFELMESGFPEESVVLGNRPEEFEKVFRRVFRWDTRLLIVLFRWFGRPIVRAFVIEADGRVVATALVTFPPGAAYVSNVVVDVAYRRRGYARTMLEESRRTAERAGRRYIALDVLDTNAGARTLYESIGYRPLRQRSEFVLDDPGRFVAAPPAHPSIRPMRRADVPSLVALARRATPAEVEAVLPTGRGRFLESGVVSRILSSETSAWVIDRGRGPEGHVAAAVSRATEAGHIASPTIGATVDEGLALELLATAGAWCAARRAPRVISMVADDDVRGVAALSAAGFRHARSLHTLYRTVG